MGQTKSYSAAMKLSQRSRWLAAELLVVVIGVLIALAIDEWRGNVEDAELANEYVYQLIADLRSTETQMVNAVDGNAAAEAATKALVTAFERRESMTLVMIQQLLEESQYFDNPVPVLGAAEALVSTGDLRLIGNATTRSAITSYLSRSRDYWLVPLYQYEELHRNLTLRLGILVQQSDTSNQDDGERAHKDAGMDVAGFFSNREAYAVALNLARTKNDMSRYRESVAVDSAQLRRSLESPGPKE